MLQAKADPSKETVFKARLGFKRNCTCTPLAFALDQLEHDSEDIIRLLLDFGADPARTENSLTSELVRRHYSVTCLDVMRFCIDCLQKTLLSMVAQYLGVDPASVVIPYIV